MERILARLFTVWLTLSVCSEAVGNKDVSEFPGLLTAYHLALEEAPEVQVARTRFQADRQVADKRRSRLLPSLSVSAEYGQVERQSEGIAGLFSASDNHYPREVYQATFSQPLLNLRDWHAWQAGKTRARGARAGFDASLQDFRLHIIETYFEVLRAQGKLESRNAEERALQQQKKKANQQLKAGTVSLLELLEINAELERVNVSLIRARTKLDHELYKLESLTNTNVEQVLTLSNRVLSLANNRRLLPQLRPHSSIGNPTLERLRLVKTAHQQEALAAEAAGYPHLSLDLAYRHNAASGSNSLLPGSANLSTETASIAVRMELPLYSGGGISARNREKQYRYNWAKARFREKHQEVATNLRRQYNAVYIQRKAISAARHAVSAQELAMTAAKKGYRAGIRDMVDILQARRENFAARESLEDDRINLVLALARLHRSAGSLTEDQLHVFDSWLQKP